VKFSLRHVVGALSLPAQHYPETLISGWSVDSRTIELGDLYFALAGPNHDGHDFVGEVLAKGAAAVVVERPVQAEGPVLRVADTLEALQALAGWARRRWGGQVVAVTGSAGKTTTKEVIAHLLETALPVARSSGNLNNHVGVPLSILRISEEARVAVLEIGMNHAGEIRRLARIAAPDIGVVTNVGHAHVEFFSSIDEVALAKRELIEALPPGGFAVLNADDERVARFREVHSGAVVTYGLSASADVRAEEVEYHSGGARFRVGDSVWFDSPLAGPHGVLNVLAGIAVAGVLGIEPGMLREAVRSLASGDMRGRRLVHKGVTVFDDCYNSNPEAARRMLDLLGAEPARRRVAVLGEMLELGRWSESLHREVGVYAAARGIDLLIGIRGAARHMVESGQACGAAIFFDDPAQAGEFLRGELRPGDAVLFKGSRGTRVEMALRSFME
jgi:UDP-N-acetylmuramoyl-tripeptide--D-alanyl-D-alanine ligase